LAPHGVPKDNWGTGLIKEGIVKRREFLWQLSIGLGAGWLAGWLPWPQESRAVAIPARIALLADAHLVDGNPARPEARALARAVAEIRRLHPAPELVLFAGDLAHRGDPQALALGKEILSDLSAPLYPVMGEGDGGPDPSGLWCRLFGDPWFSVSYPDFQLLGLHTAWSDGGRHPQFLVAETGRRWLAAALSRLQLEKPLLILSHAPLGKMFLPWGHWTADAGRLMPLLRQFSSVVAVHGHVHHNHGAGPGFGGTFSGDGCRLALGASRTGAGSGSQPTLIHLGLPATAWPLPVPLQGTPAALHTGGGPRGCGWGVLAGQGGVWRYQTHCWEI
jgi:hypothetical protein